MSELSKEDTDSKDIKETNLKFQELSKEEEKMLRDTDIPDDELFFIVFSATNEVLYYHDVPGKILKKYVHYMNGDLDDIITERMRQYKKDNLIDYAIDSYKYSDYVPVPKSIYATEEDIIAGLKEYEGDMIGLYEPSETRVFHGRSCWLTS